jgi:hypothetical protein
MRRKRPDGKPGIAAWLMSLNKKKRKWYSVGMKVDQIFLLTVNFLFTVAAGRAAAKTSRAEIMLAWSLCVHDARLTLCRVELNQDIVMLARVLDFIETDELAFGASPST